MNDFSRERDPEKRDNETMKKINIKNNINIHLIFSRHSRLKSESSHVLVYDYLRYQGGPTRGPRSIFFCPHNKIHDFFYKSKIKDIIIIISLQNRFITDGLRKYFGVHRWNTDVYRYFLKKYVNFRKKTFWFFLRLFFFFFCSPSVFIKCKSARRFTKGRTPPRLVPTHNVITSVVSPPVKSVARRRPRTRRNRIPTRTPGDSTGILMTPRRCGQIMWRREYNII